MIDREKVANGLCHCLLYNGSCVDCPYDGPNCQNDVLDDALALMKEQEPIKPTINEYGEAYCICGENVGIIPNSKDLPKIRSKYCSECGRRMKWDG